MPRLLCGSLGGFAAWRENAARDTIVVRTSNRTKLFAAAIMAFLVIGAFFMVNVELPPWSHWLSGLNVVLFALSAIWATRWWLGWRDAAILWALLGFYALGIETLAIFTGFPYGHFGYSELLGGKLFGVTPWTVFLAWTPLIVGAYAVARSLVENKLLAVSSKPLASVVVIALTAVIATIFDLVLDPGAVRLGFWQYEGGGVFYGVPWSNFLGWLVSGAIGAALIEVFVWARTPLLPVPVQLATSAFLMIVFWTAISVFGGMLWAAVIGFGVIAVMVLWWRRFHFHFDDRVIYVDDNGTPIGTEEKLAAHHADTRLHSAFSVFIFNDLGEILLQQRALSKKTWPGVWSNSCCGHVMLHETVESAARRRVKYELGMTVRNLAVALPDFRYRAEKDGIVENEICPVLIAHAASDPKPNPQEVESIRWLKWEDFVVEVADPANGYSPWAVLEVNQLSKAGVLSV